MYAVNPSMLEQISANPFANPSDTNNPYNDTATNVSASTYEQYVSDYRDLVSNPDYMTLANAGAQIEANSTGVYQVQTTADEINQAVDIARLAKENADATYVADQFAYNTLAGAPPPSAYGYTDAPSVDMNSYTAKYGDNIVELKNQIEGADQSSLKAATDNLDKLTLEQGMYQRTGVLSPDLATAIAKVNAGQGAGSVALQKDANDFFTDAKQTFDQVKQAFIQPSVSNWVNLAPNALWAGVSAVAGGVDVGLNNLLGHTGWSYFNPDAQTIIGNLGDPTKAGNEMVLSTVNLAPFALGSAMKLAGGAADLLTGGESSAAVTGAETAVDTGSGILSKGADLSGAKIAQDLEDPNLYVVYKADTTVAPAEEAVATPAETLATPPAVQASVDVATPKIEPALPPESSASGEDITAQINTEAKAAGATEPPAAETPASTPATPAESTATGPSTGETPAASATQSTSWLDRLGNAARSFVVAVGVVISPAEDFATLARTFPSEAADLSGATALKNLDQAPLYSEISGNGESLTAQIRTEAAASPSAASAVPDSASVPLKEGTIISSAFVEARSIAISGSFSSAFDVGQAAVSNNYTAEVAQNPFYDYSAASLLGNASAPTITAAEQNGMNAFTSPLSGDSTQNVTAGELNGMTAFQNPLAEGSLTVQPMTAAEQNGASMFQNPITSAPASSYSVAELAAESAPPASYQDWASYYKAQQPETTVDMLSYQAPSAESAVLPGATAAPSASAYFDSYLPVDVTAYEAPTGYASANPVGETDYFNSFVPTDLLSYQAPSQQEFPVTAESPTATNLFNSYLPATDMFAYQAASPQNFSVNPILTKDFGSGITAEAPTLPVVQTRAPVAVSLPEATTPVPGTNSSSAAPIPGSSDSTPLTAIPDTSAPTPSTAAPTSPTYAFGDSIALGVKTQGNLGGDAVKFRSPTAVLDAINNFNTANPGALAGKDVVLSTGLSNNPTADISIVRNQITALEKAVGPNGRVTVLGLGTRPDIAARESDLEHLVEQMKVADKMNIDLKPISQFVGADQVHPNYAQLQPTLKVAEQPQIASAKNTSGPTAVTTADTNAAVPTKVALQTSAPAANPTFVAKAPPLVGIASVYTSQFGHGIATGVGWYNASAYAAALQLDLAKVFHTGYGSGAAGYALVEYGGKKLIVLVNDNGPLTPGRIIDFTPASMNYLASGAQNDGTYHENLLSDVKVTLLQGKYTPGPVNNTAAAVPTTPTSVTNVKAPAPVAPAPSATTANGATVPVEAPAEAAPAPLGPSADATSPFTDGLMKVLSYLNPISPAEAAPAAPSYNVTGAVVTINRAQQNLDNVFNQPKITVADITKALGPTQAAVQKILNLADKLNSPDVKALVDQVNNAIAAGKQAGEYAPTTEVPGWVKGMVTSRVNNILEPAKQLAALVIKSTPKPAAEAPVKTAADVAPKTTAPAAAPKAIAPAAASKPATTASKPVAAPVAPQKVAAPVSTAVPAPAATLAPTPNASAPTINLTDVAKQVTDLLGAGLAALKAPTPAEVPAAPATPKPVASAKMPYEWGPVPGNVATAPEVSAATTPDLDAANQDLADAKAKLADTKQTIKDDQTQITVITEQTIPIEQKIAGLTTDMAVALKNANTTVPEGISALQAVDKNLTKTVAALKQSVADLTQAEARQIASLKSALQNQQEKAASALTLPRVWSPVPAERVLAETDTAPAVSPQTSPVAVSAIHPNDLTTAPQPAATPSGSTPTSPGSGNTAEIPPAIPPKLPESEGEAATTPTTPPNPPGGGGTASVPPAAPPTPTEGEGTTATPPTTPPTSSEGGGSGGGFGIGRDILTGVGSFCFDGGIVRVGICGGVGFGVYSKISGAWNGLWTTNNTPQKTPQNNPSPANQNNPAPTAQPPAAPVQVADKESAPPDGGASPEKAPAAPPETPAEKAPAPEVTKAPAETGAGKGESPATQPKTPAANELTAPEEKPPAAAPEAPAAKPPAAPAPDVIREPAAPGPGKSEPPAAQPAPAEKAPLTPAPAPAPTGNSPATGNQGGGLSSMFSSFMQIISSLLMQLLNQSPAQSSPTTQPSVSRPTPTVSLQALPSTVAAGNTTTLMWSSTYTIACNILQQGGISLGVGASTGSTSTPPITATSVFIVQCTTNTGATISNGVTVNVLSTSSGQ
jgi:rare lipoprotein A (peptidoglycan hydrolase)